MTFLQRVRTHAKHRETEVAISRRLVGGAYELTDWRELESLCLRAAQIIVTGASQFVPILSNKSKHSVAAIIGSMAAGKAFVSLNPKLRIPQIVDALSATNAALAFVDSDSLRVLTTGRSEEQIRKVKWVVIGDVAQAARHLDDLADAGVDYLLFDDAQATTEPVVVEIADDVPACCLFTSGSTGTPKGVLIGHTDLTGRAKAEEKWFGLSHTDVLLSLLPFSFDVGLSQLLASIWVGSELCLSPSWLPADITAAVRERKVTGVCGVPAIWQDFLRTGSIDVEAIRSLRFITVSGGSLPETQLSALSKMFAGVEIFKTYGQTEDFRTASLRPEDIARKPGSVGRAYPGVRLMIVRDDGSECRPHEVGEVVHGGLGRMLGYLGGSQDHEKLRPVLGMEEVAVFTGDIGYVDEEGYLFLRGRRDAMAKVAGNRVFPAEIANQIAKLPYVTEAHVVIAPDGKGDAAITAFVVTSGSGQITGPQLRNQIRNLLPSYMVPHKINMLDEIPRTSTGKPDLVQLAAWAETEVNA